MVYTIIGREDVKKLRGQAFGRIIYMDTEIIKNSNSYRHSIGESDSESGPRIFKVCRGVDFPQ